MSQCPIVFTLSIIQYSDLKRQSIGPDIIPHLAGIATKILHHYHLLFSVLTYYFIQAINFRSPSPFPSRDIDNTVLLNDNRKLRP
jgi:hypothetical protein